jgi:uncharacterized protein (DUF433 family)
LPQASIAPLRFERWQNGSSSRLRRDEKVDEKSLAQIAKTLGTSKKEVKRAIEDLKRRGLAREEGGKIVLSPLAMRRAVSDVQRKLAAVLSGYLPTENPYIVRRAGKPEGKPQILNTRVLVEYIANYFNEGWGVGEIQREFPFLTREEIEAAIQYYLNHKEEIDRDREESERMYRVINLNCSLMNHCRIENRSAGS